MKHNKMLLGMDEWESSIELKRLYQLVKKHNWCIYEIHTTKHGIRFFAPVYERKEIAHGIEDACLLKTTGMLGFLFRQMKRPSRVLCVMISCLLWFVLSHTVFDITMSGDKEESKQLIQKTLREMGYQPPFYDADMEKLKLDLKKRLENEIAWMEVSKNGSCYHIQFTTKEFATITPLESNQLIAQKDGVIEHFELQHGNKLVAINDYVHAGDVLVDNILLDSNNKEQQLYVKGKVFAYTWREVHVEMKKNNIAKPFQFFQLLFTARREASKDLRKGERIYKENILQFQENAGKISMDIHYTLLEDITTPK